MPVWTESRLVRLQRLYRRTAHDVAIARRNPEQAGRLTQLLALEARLDAEILAEGGTSLRPPKRPPTHHASGRKVRRDKGTRKPPNVVAQYLARLGVTGPEVRAWAVEQGLLAPGTPGRTGMGLVEAYEAAHTPTTPEEQTA